MAHFLASTGAGYLFLAAISGIAQVGAAYGAQAIRRARNFDLDASKVLAAIMVAAGAGITAWGMHNALARTGMLDAAGAASLSWAVAAGIPIFEFAVWWVDESLRSEAEARKEAAFQDRRQQDKKPSGPLGLDPDSIDFSALPDAALLRAQSIGYAIGKRAGDEARARNVSPSKTSIARKGVK